MTHLPHPNQHGWYVFHAGQRARCPGPARNPQQAQHCGCYILDVADGELWVRPEVRLREGLERRLHPRFTHTCLKNKGGCGTPLEIEARNATAAQVA